MSEPARIRLTEAMPAASGFRAVSAVRAVPPPVAPQVIDPYIAGFEEGQRVATRLFDEERRALRTLAAAAEGLRCEPSEELAAMIAAAVERLVVEFTGRCPPEREWLLERARRAALLVEEADRAGPLHLHPADAELLADAGLDVTIVPDGSLPRGSLRLACPTGWIEDGTSLYLERLRNELATDR